MYHNYFHGLCNGKYLEIGAYDGRKHSNTFLFAKTLGWTGVLVEASPKNFRRLRHNRPESRCYHGAVCQNNTQYVHYVEKGPVSGIFEFMSPSFRSHWHGGIANENAGQEVRCAPLQDFIDDSLIHYFDFFSLDVEGAELEVLRTVNYKQTAFGIVFVEADGSNPQKENAIKAFMAKHEYSFKGVKLRSLWFANSNLESIYHQ